MSRTESAMRNRLTDALLELNRPQCLECEGTGGVDIWENEEEGIFSHWTSPQDESCDMCYGTGLVVYRVDVNPLVTG